MGVRASRSANNSEMQIVDLDGFKMMVFPDWNQICAEIAQHHTYEPHVSKHFSRFVTPNSVVADIGANIGYFSMLAASKGATVYAFEPHGRNLWLLQKNAKLNEFDINILPYALGDAERLVVYSPLSGNGQISELGQAPPVDGQQVLRTTTLDNAMQSCRPDVIKIDVEGAEALVLAGAPLTLASKPIVFSEFSVGGIKTTSRVEPTEYLSYFKGYRLHLCSRDGTLLEISSEELIAASQRSVTSFVDFVALPRE
jgi:FkbM family methyltransferase